MINLLNIPISFITNPTTFIKKPLIKNINKIYTSQLSIINNNIFNIYPKSYNILKNFFIENEGFKFGIFIFLFSNLLDYFFSKDTLLKLKKNHKDLYYKNLKKNFINLIVLSPIYYLISFNFLNKSHTIHIFEILSILCFQSIFYYISHMLMHKIKFLKKHHDFHHKFNKHIIPSSAHGVSIIEYTISYILPFLIASILINPTISSFSYSIKIVGFFNIIIHCEVLINLKLTKLFVSPSKHINHHKLNKGNYSAPLLNAEFFVD